MENLNDLKNVSKENFLSDYKYYLTAQRALEICINICIDIGNHIVSLNNKEKPETYVEIFEILAKSKIITSDLKEKLIKMVRFRNLLGHFYLEINHEIIYKILQNNLDDFNKFSEAIFSKFKTDLSINFNKL